MECAAFHPPHHAKINQKDARNQWRAVRASVERSTAATHTHTIAQCGAARKQFGIYARSLSRSVLEEATLCSRAGRDEHDVGGRRATASRTDGDGDKRLHRRADGRHLPAGSATDRSVCLPRLTRSETAGGARLPVIPPAVDCKQACACASLRTHVCNQPGVDCRSGVTNGLE